MSVMYRNAIFKNRFGPEKQLKKREIPTRVEHMDYVSQAFSYRSGMTLVFDLACSVELMKKHTRRLKIILKDSHEYQLREMA